MIDAETAILFHNASTGDACSWEEVYASFGCSMDSDAEDEDEPG